MTSPVGHLTAIQIVRPIPSRGTYPSFVAGEGVIFYLPQGEVRATVIGVDAKARADLPLGLPYRVVVRQSPPMSGYAVGGECTIRAGCLERDKEAPPPPPSYAPIRPAPPALPAAPSLPLFLVAFRREGGNVPVQGTMLVEGESLPSASAAAMAMLTAELEADVKERGELPEAMVRLLSASEVPTLQGGRGARAPVLATVSW
jgi:hypothetical protein